MRFISLLILLTICHLGFAEPVKKVLNALIATAPHQLNIGIKIQNITTGDVIYQKNSARYFIPASTLKTLTATAALLYLGKHYRYQTQLLVEKKTIQHATLSSDVYIKFNGDPTLTVNDLQTMLQQLSHRGVKHIIGNLYIDNSRFNPIVYGPGWIWDDLQNCFSAPLDAAIINHNCFKVTLIAGNHNGAKTNLDNKKFLRFVSMRNHTITQQKTSDINEHPCLLQVTIDKTNHYDLTGCITSKKKITLTFAIPHSKPYISAVLRYLLKKNHLTITGKILFAKTKPHLIVLTTHHSQPLAVVVHNMLKKSDNLVANALFKTLGTRYYQQPGTWKNGAMALKNILWQQAHSQLADAVIVDGAGLSRYNLITPEQLSHLLYFAFYNGDIGTTFITSLPVSGIDGTLQHQVAMNLPTIIAHIHAKTGSMRGVLALAGYVYTEKHHVLSVVIIMNNINGKLYRYYFLEMDILKYLIKNL
ncbi:MAG: D-alanyl-D-alanine carboxypeptidase/D-alanyl-D-alanine-endopeptidase [Gammaproteobacteria bacterium]|nr:D-alanyl-D-alanine carboxypeptidase/D-alanyl-D-alanine-endopeptidase [Gammaproteobacteria bacterium]